MTKKYHGIAIVVMALCLVGCSSNLGSEGTVAISALNLPQSENIWEAEIICTRGRHNITRNVMVSGTNLTAEIPIPVGSWDISLNLMDNDGVVSYQDTVRDVMVYPDQPVVIDFQLKPAAGTVKVIIDLESYPHSEYVLRARVYFNDDYEEITRETDTDPFTGEYDLVPGSYDFNVQLYTESFRSSDRVDLGTWQTIDVTPFETQTIVWHPFLENLTIIANIYLLPDPPTNLTAELKDDSVELNWDFSTANDVEGYHIYWQPSPFESYQIIASVDQDTAEFTHDLSELETIPPKFFYSIAPYSDIIIGYRCSPVVVQID